jgi:purine-binding chemotaxis protein CheW
VVELNHYGLAAIMPSESSSKTPIDWARIRARVLSAEAFHGGDSEQEILRRRAQVLARPLPDNTRVAETIHLVAFELSGQLFGLEAAQVRETLGARELTALPGLPATVSGVVNIRGRVVPAFDLRPLLQLPPSAAPEAQRLLLAEYERTEFAILADAIAGLREAPAAQLRREVPGLHQHLLRGLLDDGLALLDLPSLFASLVVTDEPQR